LKKPPQSLKPQLPKTSSSLTVYLRKGNSSKPPF
jgi:hypothetical protein